MTLGQTSQTAIAGASRRALSVAIAKPAKGASHQSDPEASGNFGESLSMAPSNSPKLGLAP
jgi:hypothetical protein